MKLKTLRELLEEWIESYSSKDMITGKRYISPSKYEEMIKEIKREDS